MRVNPRNITQRDTSLKIHINRFCLIWKSNGINFNQKIEDESKPNFKVVDNVISDEHGKSFFNYDHKPKKFQPPLTNIVVYDLERDFSLKLELFHIVVAYIN